ATTNARAAEQTGEQPAAQIQTEQPAAPSEPPIAQTTTATAPVAEPANTEVAEPAHPLSNVKIEEPVQETVAAHDDFDWSIDKRNVAAYTQEEKEKYDKVYENTFVQLSDGE